MNDNQCQAFAKDTGHLMKFLLMQLLILIVLSGSLRLTTRTRAKTKFDGKGYWDILLVANSFHLLDTKISKLGAY